MRARSYVRAPLAGRGGEGRSGYGLCAPLLLQVVGGFLRCFCFSWSWWRAVQSSKVWSGGCWWTWTARRRLEEGGNRRVCAVPVLVQRDQASSRGGGRLLQASTSCGGVLFPADRGTAAPATSRILGDGLGVRLYFLQVALGSLCKFQGLFVISFLSWTVL